MKRFVMPVITITDVDDIHYVLLTDEDIVRMFESKPDMTENEMFGRIMAILSHSWVPAMELDGTRVLLNTHYIKKVGAKNGRMVMESIPENEGEEDDDEDVV